MSGRNMIAMSDLKELFGKLKCSDVSTYIQSGNIVFRYSGSEKDLPALIAAAIEKKYGFDVPVVIRTAAEMKKIAGANPFLAAKDTDAEKLHVTFLASAPAAGQIAALSSYNYEPDRFILSGGEVYLYCPGGYGNTKLNNTFFESKLKVRATTRNWKTVNKLAGMSASLT